MHNPCGDGSLGVWSSMPAWICMMQLRKACVSKVERLAWCALCSHLGVGPGNPRRCVVVRVSQLVENKPHASSCPAIDREPSSVVASPAVRLNAPGVPPQSVCGGAPELAVPVGVCLAPVAVANGSCLYVPVGICSDCAVTRAYTCTWCMRASVRAFARACVRPRAVCTCVAACLRVCVLACACLRACVPACVPASCANCVRGSRLRQDI